MIISNPVKDFAPLNVSTKKLDKYFSTESLKKFKINNDKGPKASLKPFYDSYTHNIILILKINRTAEKKYKRVNLNALFFLLKCKF